MYQLIFASELPSAKNFQKWVFSEVLQDALGHAEGSRRRGKGTSGGEKAQENRRKLVEFKNMLIGLFETLFGPDD